jgi:hypothetical protein
MWHHLSTEVGTDFVDKRRFPLLSQNMERSKCNLGTKTKQESRLSTGQVANRFIRCHGQSNGKTLYIQIYSALSYHIPDEHFTFLPGRNTTLQLFRVTECVTAEFNEQPYTAVISLRVCKA